MRQLHRWHRLNPLPRLTRLNPWVQQHPLRRSVLQNPLRRCFRLHPSHRFLLLSRLIQSALVFLLLLSSQLLPSVPQRPLRQSGQRLLLFRLHRYSLLALHYRLRQLNRWDLLLPQFLLPQSRRLRRLYPLVLLIPWRRLRPRGQSVHPIRLHPSPRLRRWVQLLLWPLSLRSHRARYQSVLKS